MPIIKSVKIGSGVGKTFREDGEEATSLTIIFADKRYLEKSWKITLSASK